MLDAESSAEEGENDVREVEQEASSHDDKYLQQPAKVPKNKTVEEKTVLSCIICFKTDADGRRWWATVKCRNAAGTMWYENNAELCYCCGFVAEARSSCIESFTMIVRKVTSPKPDEQNFRERFLRDIEKINPMTGELLEKLGDSDVQIDWQEDSGWQMYAKALIIPEHIWNDYHRGEASAEQAHLPLKPGIDLRANPFHGVLLDKYQAMPDALRRQALTIKVTRAQNAINAQPFKRGGEHAFNAFSLLGQKKIEEQGLDDPKLYAIPTYNETLQKLEQFAEHSEQRDKELQSRIAGDGETIREVVSNSAFHALSPGPMQSQPPITPQKGSSRRVLQGPPPILGMAPSSSMSRAVAAKSKQGAPSSSSDQQFVAGHGVAKPKADAGQVGKGRPLGMAPRIPLFQTDEKGEVMQLNFHGIFMGRQPTSVAKPARDRYAKLRLTDPVAAGDAKEIADLCHSTSTLNAKNLASASWVDLQKAWSATVASLKCKDVLKDFPLENMTIAVKRKTKELQASGNWEHVAPSVCSAASWRTNAQRQRGLYFSLPQPRAADVFVELQEVDQEAEVTAAASTFFNDCLVDAMIGGHFYLLVSSYDDSKLPSKNILRAAESHLALEPEDEREQEGLPSVVQVAYRTLRGFAWLVIDLPQQFHQYKIDDAELLLPELTNRNSGKKTSVVHNLQNENVKPGPGLCRWLKQGKWGERIKLMQRTEAAVMTRGAELHEKQEQLEK